jgi:hypothetical protein
LLDFRSIGRSCDELNNWVFYYCFKSAETYRNSCFPETNILLIISLPFQQTQLIYKAGDKETRRQGYEHSGRQEQADKQASRQADKQKVKKLAEKKTKRQGDNETRGQRPKKK